MSTAAITISAIKGVNTSTDGKHALITMTSGQDDGVFAFAFELLIPLMQSASHAFGQCVQIQNNTRNVRHVVPCEWWSIDPAPDLQSVLFSFRVAGGIEMTFQVSKSQIQKMKDALEMADVKPIQILPGLTKQ